jgi:two-component system, LytTR family, response regulator
MSATDPIAWRVLIVDDEPPARDTLKLLVSSEPDFEVAGECSHGEEAVAAITRAVPDAMFLDVQMPGMDGFEVLRTVGPATIPALVFVTAYDRYALRAFETHALDYLLKPFSDERFAAVLNRVRIRLRERRLAEAGRKLSALLDSGSGPPRARQLIVRDGSRTVVIPYDEIIWIEAEDYYVRIHATSRRTLVRLSLKSLAEELDAACFVRVHRSAIVNLAFIRELEPLASGDQRLVLHDGTELRVSRTYRPALDDRLGRR